jgi:hypothetical protein
LRSQLRVALDVVLGRALAFFLRELFVSLGPILGVTLGFLMHPLATHGRVAGEVAGGLLAAAEKPVEE